MPAPPFRAFIAASALAAATTALVAATMPSAPVAQPPPPTSAPDYPVQSVPFTAVTLDDAFWAPRIEANRTTSIPTAFEQCERTGRVDNFRRAAQVLRGEPLANTKAPGYPFDDTDLYKVIEAASFSLRVHPDPTLDAYVDRLIATIAAAQEADGYLYTTRTINPSAPHPWAGKARWELERDDSHELYNLGHLFEAAVAHHQATGKRTLLDVAVKGADLLDRTFGSGKASIWPGHQVTEMGLVRLYRVTGETRYLALAKFLLDARGPNPGEKTNPRGLEYNQAHLRAIEQTEPVGHAVRAMYMYAGMTDVAAMTSDAAYTRALDAIWTHLVGSKLYLTGGIGSTGAGEAFGKPYELPNMTAYNETCASVGMDYWNHRLFLLHGDGRYLDVMERTLFNALLSGVALDGKTFFYPNPLESAGQHQRSPWFGVACCPGNITRFLASLPGYLYAHRGDDVYVNLYAAGSATVATGNGRQVHLVQQTRYPYDGSVTLTVTPDAAREFSLLLRIPGWAMERPVPSDLYTFATSSSKKPRVLVNGQDVALHVDRGFMTLRRTWAPGDVVTLDLPMPARRVVAHASVAADRDRVAIQRGPLVYAAEWPDNDGDVRNVVLSGTAPLSTAFRRDLLGGVQVVTARGTALSRDADGALVRRERTVTLIPYATWANRGAGPMTVWMATSDAAARPRPFPTVAMRSRVSTSPARRSAHPINDGELPNASSDPTAYFDWWPQRGEDAWVEYALDAPATVDGVSVYWFDDTGRGQVRVPASWRVLYRDGEQWRPVTTTATPGVERDRENVVRFHAVRTTGLRLEVTMQPGFSAGVQEWTLRTVR
ncbi:MAG TPA: beta-L-arabinofuranosidase domain-containing protein [Luteitalea sp.]|nr:beta-L-arabinofuranosidase domain-containing protein [Luteitalea sp.]